MFKNSQAFSGFSVNDILAAKKFYSEILELDVHDEGEMGISLHFSSGNIIFLYPKENHVPATFTVLNFPVDNIDDGVQYLKEKGVTLEMYENMHQDANGIARGIVAKMGPDIAWFTDPAGNILSILQEK